MNGKNVNGTRKPNPVEAFANTFGKWILLSTLVLYTISVVICVAVAIKSANDLIVISGAFWLGITVGVLLGFYSQEAERWDQKALSASVGIIIGSGIVLLLRYLAPTVHEIWFYPMGLVGGFIIGTVWEFIDPV